MNDEVYWLHPLMLTPPHRVGRPEQVESLAAQFRKSGWDPRRPALVGYGLGETVQLLSGSHRWAAAVSAGLEAIPVVLRTVWAVEEAWGDLGAWARIMDAPAAGARPSA